MGLGSFIAERPGKFLAVLGAAALGVAAFWSDDSVALRHSNPWALDPAHQHRPDRLAPIKDAIERLGDRFGVHLRFAPVPMPPQEPLAMPSPSPGPWLHRRRHGHRHRKLETERAL